MSVVTKCLLETGILPVVFCEIPLMVSEAFGVTRLRAPGTEMMQVDENGTVGTRQVDSSAGSTKVRNSFST